MAKKAREHRDRNHETPLPGSEKIPPGATRRAADADTRPWEEPSHLDDRHAVGTAGGGTEVGGLAGSNFGAGDPDVEELNEAMATGLNEPEAETPGGDHGYAGQSGGAVGGTPAGKRSRGGRARHSIKPGGTHRGDSTVGSRPDGKAKQ